MSEIFAPGSVAGPQGPAGAAGSLMNIKSLTDALVPNLSAQLFDSTRVLTNYGIHSDGSLHAGDGWDVSPLMYCPAATSGITTLPVRFGDVFNTAYFALYDANGNFLSSISSTSVGAAYNSFATVIDNGVAFSMPGTQTYCRVAWATANQGGTYPVNSGAGFWAVASGTATVGSLDIVGLETIQDCNNKVAATLVTATANMGAVIESVANAVLPGGVSRNLFDCTNFQANTILGSDGTASTSSGWHLQTIYCPGATSVITDVPIRLVEPSECVCVYDAQGNFIADLTAAWTADGTIAGVYLSPNVMHTLPGTQTYLKFSYGVDFHFGVDGWANSPQTASVYAGNTASPPPSSLTSLPFQPFTGTLNVTVKTAQELGVTPSIYSGTPIDCTAALNAFLATATATNAVKLILDTGMISVAGLVISPYGNTTIEGCGPGSGIRVLGGSPQDAIRIGAYTAATGNSEGAYNITPPARSAINIVLRNFTLDPTGAITASANQPVTGAAAHSTYGCVIANASNVKIENVDFLQAPTYAVMITNCDHVKVTGCSFTSVGTIHDGIHIDGLCEKIGIENCDFATGDDAIALNAPEGYGGDISDVTVTNCRFLGSLTVMRIYTSVTTATLPSNNVHKVRRVVVSNCTGTTRQFCFDLGITDGVNPTTDVDQLVDLSISNCSFSSPNGLAGLYTPIGSLRFTNVIYAPTGTAALINGAVSSLARLELDGLIIRRDSFANSAPTSIVGMIEGVLGTVVLRKIAVVDTPGTSYPPIGALVSTGIPISVLDLDGIDMTHIAALVDSGYTNVTEVRGAGVLATGASIPDSVMDNGWLYASSTASGAVSLKVAGTAKRLTLT
jgi:hypothetical protein